eukprot:6469187-Amphidinium_carterae.3
MDISVCISKAKRNWSGKDLAQVLQTLDIMAGGGELLPGHEAPLHFHVGVDVTSWERQQNGWLWRWIAG